MAKKTTAAKATAKPMTKSEIVSGIAEETELTKKQVNAVFEAMSGQIKKSLGRRGPGAYTVPGLMKLVVVRKPATKARKGINPFTGEETTFKAKPARNIVKIRPLKNLKDMV
jgi:nucleoid DNA-binding protein